jgi:Tfp pilus assembly protein PilF
MKAVKTAKQKPNAAAIIEQASAPGRKLWPYALGCFAALLVVLEVYWPAVNGPFLLDDTYLPYMLPGFDLVPFSGWIKGARPLLMFSYWLNFQASGNQLTFGYHIVNLILHILNGALVLLAVRKVLDWAGTEKHLAGVLSIFAAGLFLLHPLQTESVSYIASRSETLSVFFVLAAFVVFIYRKQESVSIPNVIAVSLLFACAALTKEHTVVFPVLLLLTDYYWNPGYSLTGARRNWKLYVTLGLGGAAALVIVWRVLSSSTSAGFGLSDINWRQYFLTQCRVLWEYLGMFLVPVGQNIDPDVAISAGWTDYTALLGMIALIGVSVGAWIWRRRFSLASYGWFVFLILVAPTSSFVPLRDPMAERRLYLPFIGLLFITVEFLRRWKTSRNTIVAVLSLVLVVEAAVAYQRNVLWGSAPSLWKDSASKSPRKLRPAFQLAMAYFNEERYPEAVDQFQKTAQLQKPGFELLLDWALAYQNSGRPADAVAKLREAAAIENSAHAQSQIGMVYGQMGLYPLALDALAAAEQLDPGFAMTYYYRGLVYGQQGLPDREVQELQHVLALDPQNKPARDALAKMGR